MSAAKNPYTDPYDLSENTPSENTPPGGPQEKAPPGGGLDEPPRTPRLAALRGGTDPLTRKWLPAGRATEIVERFERGEASWNETIDALEAIALDDLPTGAQLLEELE